MSDPDPWQEVPQCPPQPQPRGMGTHTPAAAPAQRSSKKKKKAHPCLGAGPPAGRAGAPNHNRAPTTMASLQGVRGVDELHA